eukprot:gene703-10412_t
MADISHAVRPLNVLVMLIVFTTNWRQSSSEKGTVSLETIEYWASRIGDETVKFAEEMMGVSTLAKSYESYDLEIERVNGSELAAELAQKMEQFFSWKNRALRILAEKAERAEENFRDSEEELNYYAAKNLDGTLKLMYDSHFGVPINTSASVVHIPTEVYDRSPKVARDIKWTKNLNKVFVDNFEMFPDLSWQYFGSAEGIHRQYPGRGWPVTPGKPDLYDARRRPWSGSLLGLRTQIAKLASNVIVDTLSTNDFFHVVLFNNESKLICCEDHGLKLIQATRRNKEFIKHQLKQWVATSTADWKQGLEMAFTLLKNARERNEGTQCQQALLILSDGSASYEKEIFEKYNPDKKIRVFTFVIGPPQYRVEELKDMACKNRGYFLRIPSVGTVWETVTSYIRVLSRPVGVEKVKPTMFTSVFVDATGSGLVSTGSTPVFRNSNTTDSQLLGVMATDVPVKDMNEFINYPLIGHNGYVFAFDNNGLILIHPGINEVKLGKLWPQPNMDIDQLEYAVHNQSDVAELRESMILDPKGAKTFEAYIKTADDLRVSRHRMEYHYFKTHSSPFSIGMTSPEYGYSIVKPKISYEDGKAALETVEKIKGWPYCSKVWNHKNLKSSLIALLEKGINGQKISCDQRMLGGLLIDANVTQNMSMVWKSSQESRQEHEVYHVFLRTHFGIIRTSDSQLPLAEVGSKDANSSVNLNPDPTYYGRAVRQPGSVLTLSVPPYTGKGVYKNILSIYAPINLKKQKITVAGERNFEIEGLYCYLLDENGFIIGSNEPSDVGKFFGIVDSKVMAKLIANETASQIGVYNVIKLPDYQASCKLIEGEGSSASKLLPRCSINSLPFRETLLLNALSYAHSYDLAPHEKVPHEMKYEECAIGVVTNVRYCYIYTLIYF